MLLTAAMKGKKENTFNVLQEQASVGKKTVESGKVYVHKKVHEENKEVAVPVVYEEVEVTRVPVNKYVDAAPSVTHDGNKTIIPVIKEVLVVEKKLLLVEEVHITKHVIEKTEQHTVPLRREEIEIEHYTRNSSKD